MTIPPTTMTLLAEILDERMKQLGQGYTPEHDDALQHGELAQAAAFLALAACEVHAGELEISPPAGFPGARGVPWPLPNDGINTQQSVRKFLLSGATMLLAEIERLDRLRAAGEIEYCGGCGALVWRDAAVVDVEGEVLCPACAHGCEIAYAHEPDPVARFLRECCDRNPEASETARVLYAGFQDWCETVAGIFDKDQLSALAFGQRLDTFPWISRVKAFGTVHYRGLCLRER